MGHTLLWPIVPVTRKTSDISRTKFQKWNVYRLVMSFLCTSHWNPVLGWEWSCSWSSAGRRCSRYRCVINNYIAYYSGSYINCLSVIHYGPMKSYGVKGLKQYWPRHWLVACWVPSHCLRIPTCKFNHRENTSMKFKSLLPGARTN